ncbi:MAG: hypothetical protein JXR60_06025 [Bacteroidales bacterium]|nr:hypothetical protein [Bacteroidales bacterium]
MTKAITEQEIKEIGFKLTDHYEHDQFNTKRYQKGILQVEFTYEGETLRTVDLTLDEVNCMPVNKTELEILDIILNKQSSPKSKHDTTIRDDMFGFLHRHPKLEMELALDSNHAIVDMKDWKIARSNAVFPRLDKHNTL